MPRVFGGEAFAFEDMPQMGPAGGADDFRPVAVRIGAAEHGAGHGVVKGRPAASGVELVARAVERLRRNAGRHRFRRPYGSSRAR